MPKIFVDQSETIDRTIKKFRKRCEREGLFGEIKKRKFFSKPSDRKRKAKSEARKKLLKKIRREKQRMKRLD